MIIFQLWTRVEAGPYIFDLSAWILKKRWATKTPAVMENPPQSRSLKISAELFGNVGIDSAWKNSFIIVCRNLALFQELSAFFPNRALEEEVEATGEEHGGSEERGNGRVGYWDSHLLARSEPTKSLTVEPAKKNWSSPTERKHLTFLA